MTVKQCAAELGISVALLREMLRNGLLAGQKRGGQWRIEEASVEALRQALRGLRGALPGVHDESCFSWLYDPDIQDVLPARPWKAPMPPVTDAWLGELPAVPPGRPGVPRPGHPYPARHDSSDSKLPEPPADRETDLPPSDSPPPDCSEDPVVETRNPDARPRVHWQRTGDACPRCQQPLVSQFIDADLGYGWICPDCQLSPASQGPAPKQPAQLAHAWHSADFEIEAIVRRSQEEAPT